MPLQYNRLRASSTRNIISLITLTFFFAPHHHNILHMIRSGVPIHLPIHNNFFNTINMTSGFIVAYPRSGER